MNSTSVLTGKYPDLISTELLSKIYQQARVQTPKKLKPWEYPPIRKHYNVHLFG